MFIRGIALASLFLIAACSGGAEAGNGGGDSGEAEGVYSDINALIADVEAAGFTCWEWGVDGDNSLMGAAASASCYTEQGDKDVYYSVGRIALFASTEARDSAVEFALTEVGRTKVVVGPNYYITAEDANRLDPMAEKVDGAELETSEFVVN